MPYFNYPKITRDISIKINTHITIEKIIKHIDLIKENKLKLLESFIILNEYYESKTNKIISLRTTYRSKTRTLTNKEVEILDNIFKKELGCILQET